MIKRLLVMIVVLLIVTGLSTTISAKNQRRLANGYMVEPAASSLISELAKFFKGYTLLRKTGSGCESETIRYIELDGEDKFYQFVVRKADQDGNRNGIAEVTELKAMWDTACTNRGK